MSSTTRQLPERSLLSYDELYGEHRSFTVIERDPPLFGPKSPTKVKFKVGLYRRKGKLEAIAAYLPKGMTDDNIVLATGCAVETVRKLRYALEAEAGKPFLCACGQRVGHGTYCPIMEGKKPHMYRLTPEKVRYIRTHYRFRTHGINKLALEVQADRASVYDALIGRYWSHVKNPGPIDVKDLKKRVCKRHALRSQIVKLLRMGRSVSSIAHELPITKSEVRRIRNQCGLPVFVKSARELRLAA